VIRQAAIIACVVCSGLGCAATQVRTDRDASVAAARYRTFALKRGEITREGIPDARDTLTRERIDEAVQDELFQKGLKPTNLNPDLIVTYTAAERTQPERAYDWGYWADGWPDAYWGAGDWRPYYATGPHGSARAPFWSTSKTRQRVLAIEVIDANTKNLVWRSNERAVNKDFRKPKEVEKAVDKALQEFRPGPSP
jgi:uncharacterized protein DUF4136